MLNFNHTLLVLMADMICNRKEEKYVRINTLLKDWRSTDKIDEDDLKGALKVLAMITEA